MVVSKCDSTVYQHNHGHESSNLPKMYRNPHGKWYVVGLCTTWVVMIFTLAMNILAFYDADNMQLGIFTIEGGLFSEELDIEILPTRGVFIIWIFVFAHQLIWLIYATSNIFRKTNSGVPLYLAIPFLHWSTFVFYNLNLIGNISWLLLWDRHYLIAALVPIILNVIAAIICTGISLHGIESCHSELCKEGFRAEHRFSIGFATNGFAVFGSWTSLETIFTLAATTEEESGMHRGMGTTVALTVLTFGMMIWFILDLGELERHTRFVASPYLLFIGVLLAIVWGDFEATTANFVFVIMLLVAVLFMFLYKLFLMWRHEKKHPAFPSKGHAHCLPHHH